MIYGFVKQSAGHVRIYSEVGRGMPVKLYLRRADDFGLDDDAVAVEFPLGQGETVLVVEDYPTVRLLMIDILEELGYLLIEVLDGAAAIPILQWGCPISMASKWPRSGGRAGRI